MRLTACAELDEVAGEVRLVARRDGDFVGPIRLCGPRFGRQRCSVDLTVPGRHCPIRAVLDLEEVAEGALFDALEAGALPLGEVARVDFDEATHTPASIREGWALGLMVDLLPAGRARGRA